MADNPPPLNDDPVPGPVAVDRNRYFTGKFMTARDFALDSDYALSRLRHHQRTFHGWGIVRGLHVKPHPAAKDDPQSDCARRWVVVTPGAAVDAYGRDVFLAKEVIYQLPLPPDAPDPANPGVAPPFLLCIRYAEVGTEPVPSLIDDTPSGATDAPAPLAFNRVHEGYRLEVHRLDDPLIGPGCWRLPNVPKAHCDCGAKPPPDAPCGRLIPLALISQIQPAGTGLKPVLSIDTTGRRHLATPPRLTQIGHFNWTHGGTHDVDDFLDPQPPPPPPDCPPEQQENPDHDQGHHHEHEHHNHHHHEHHHHHHPKEPPHRLRIDFTCALKPWRELPNPKEGLGINEHTFVVQYKGSEDNLAFLPSDPDHPPYYDDEARAAVFTIDPGFLRRSRLDESVVYVTLECDFVPDAHGHAVDGDHLLGGVPTGDGRPGGAFKSWFRVKVDCNKTKEPPR